MRKENQLIIVNVRTIRSMKRWEEGEGLFGAPCYFLTSAFMQNLFSPGKNQQEFFFLSVWIILFEQKHFVS